MPTYEFRCPDGTIIERIFKISEVPDEIPTPSGDGVATRIISGGAGLVFKGSGFYLTDYGRNAHRTQGDAKTSAGEGKATGEVKSGGEAKASGGDAKPAAGRATGSASSSSSSSASSSSSSSSGGGSPAAA